MEAKTVDAWHLGLGLGLGNWSLDLRNRFVFQPGGGATRT